MARPKQRQATYAVFVAALLPGPIATESKVLTVVALLGELHSVGPTVEPLRGLTRIAEISTVSTRTARVGGGEARAVGDRYITILLRREDLSPEQQERVFNPPRVPGEVCDCDFFPP